MHSFGKFHYLVTHQQVFLSLLCLEIEIRENWGSRRPRQKSIDFFFCIFLNLSFCMTTHQCHRLSNSLSHPCVRLREFAQQFNNLNNKTLRKTTRIFVLKDLERVVGSAVLIKWFQSRLTQLTEKRKRSQFLSTVFFNVFGRKYTTFHSLNIPFRFSFLWKIYPIDLSIYTVFRLKLSCYQNLLLNKKSYSKRPAGDVKGLFTNLFTYYVTPRWPLCFWDDCCLRFSHVSNGCQQQMQPAFSSKKSFKKYKQVRTQTPRTKILILTFLSSVKSYLCTEIFVF